MVAADGVAIAIDSNVGCDGRKFVPKRNILGQGNGVGAAASWTIAFGAVAVGGDDGICQTAISINSDIGGIDR